MPDCKDQEVMYDIFSILQGKTKIKDALHLFQGKDGKNVKVKGTNVGLVGTSHWVEWWLRTRLAKSCDI